ncbi:MAG TPA: ABC transporter permease, partial [Ignavibacteriaceae bacterium]|nr:ABC transporter permease [Ignavibacteriaceae bacterium]
MFKHYFQNTLRFLKHNKLFAGINLFGLSISLAATFLILLYVINEISYDHCHKNGKRAFRVISFYPDTKLSGNRTPYVLKTTLKEEFPQIQKVITVMPIPLIFKTENDSISETAISTDPQVFDIFTLPLVSGSSGSNLLEDKNSIILSSELSRKLFGKLDPTGKTIMVTAFDGNHLLTVKGVFEDVPENSTFRPECIISSIWSVDYAKKKFYITNPETTWSQDLWSTWVLLPKKSNTRALEKQINNYTGKKIKGRPASIYSFQNLMDVYMKSGGIINSGKRGNITSIRIFSALAFLIIVVACINYIILSTAISSGRATEIGIRKAFGAGIGKIRNQFLYESLLLVSISVPLAFFLAWFFLPFTEQMFQTRIHVMSSNITIYILSGLFLVIIIGALSGFYTSAYLSGLNVLHILNHTANIAKGKFFRSFLIILQLIIFCSFMSGSLITRAQYKYEVNKYPGFYNKCILLINLGRNFNGYKTYLNTIKSNPNVILAAGSNVSIPVNNASAAFQMSNFQNPEIQVMVDILIVDYNFLETMG